MTTSSSEDDASLRKESQFDDSTESLSILSQSKFRPISSSRKRTSNTGPKGVRADARAYEASKRDALRAKALLSGPAMVVDESGSEDEWMSRWREKRMKELSKRGVAGVNLFGQVDDVDAQAYLAAVDYEEGLETNGTEMSKRNARQNIVTVVLIYNNVPSRSFSFLFWVADR